MTENLREEIKRHFDVVTDAVRSELRRGTKRLGLLQKTGCPEPRIDLIPDEVKEGVQLIGGKADAREARIVVPKQKAA